MLPPLRCDRYVRSRWSMVRLINRETTSAIYITPAKDSSMTSARAIPVTGRMSLSPTLESRAILRKSSSVQVRGPSGFVGALKLPGRNASHAA